MEIKHNKSISEVYRPYKWKAFLDLHDFKTWEEIDEALTKLELEALTNYYTDILGKPTVYVKTKLHMDNEFIRRGERRYICPDESWLNRHYVNPINLPEEPMIEVLTSNTGEELIHGCDMYEDFLPSELLIFAILYSICIGKEELVPPIKEHIKSLGTYDHLVKKFLTDHADEIYIKRIKEIKDSVKSKYVI
jgi:hypothetical protein